MTVVAVVIGCLSVYGGLLLSYHLDLAAGAAMAALAVGSFFVVLPVRGLVTWVAGRRQEGVAAPSTGQGRTLDPPGLVGHGAGGGGGGGR